MTLPGQLGLPLATPRPAGATPAMGDRLCALLVRRGRPLEVGQVASQLLRLRRCPEVMQRRLVAQIVDGDHRLAWLGRDLVGLAPMDWRARDIRTGSFCVVDLETTGGSPGRSKITEIGAVRVRDMRIVERFSTLVDPGRPIPEVITALTGIDDATVAGAPAIEQALDAFVAFAGDDVLVAHNAPFDLRFLNHERRMASGTYFTQPWLDTLTMARRLLAGRVSRNDLTSLSEWADTTVRPCHRALPDAEATAELLLRFLEMLVDDGHDTLERAVRFAAPGGTRHSWKLALADELPSGPGVYLMRDRRGGVLYVGKARDLRRRVRSYFGPGGRHGRLIGRALEQLERIDHECCDSELDALLREAVLLRELQPPCNRRGVGGRVRVLRVVGGEFARLRLAPDPDRGDRIAVVHGERTGALALRALHRLHPIRDCHPLCPPHAGLGPPARPCAGPCGQDDPAAHAAAMHDVAALFGEHPGPALAGLGRRLVEAARDGRWIADRESRDELHALLGLARRQWRTHTAALRVAFLAEPGGVAGRAVLFGVVRGAVVMRVVADAGDVDARVEQVLDAMAAALGAAAPPAPPEVAAILEQRIRDRGAPGAVACDPAGPDPGERHLALLAARWALGMSGRSAGGADDGA